MVQVPVHNVAGEVVGQLELSDAVFGVPLNEAVVHQAMVRQLADARQGTVGTKTRGLVSGGGRKLFRQKGTGSARRGSRRAPLLRGGGVVFGPQPRSYRQAIPKKMRRLALRCVLSAKVANEEVIVLDEFSMQEPKTKEMARILKDLGVESSALIVTAQPDSNVYKSARNIQRVTTLPASMLSVVDVLAHRKLMMSVAAVKVIEEVWTPERKGDTPVAA